MKGTVTFSEKYDTTMDPFVVGAVPLLTKKGPVLVTKDTILYRVSECTW